VNILQQLQQFADDDPNDPFNLYALALELLKTDAGKAVGIFEKLLTEHESYLPTYYQAAGLFESVGKHEQAIAILEKGLAIARNSGEMKTMRELQTMLDEIGDL
jgi:tetratricopeptide (TPR) repeat protein